MGWVELFASVILFVLQIYPAAVAFAVAGIFVSLIANLVRQPPKQSADQAPRPTRRTLRTTIIILGWGLVAAGVVFALVLHRYVFAFLFVLWAVLLALLTGRLRA